MECSFDNVRRGILFKTVTRRVSTHWFRWNCWLSQPMRGPLPRWRRVGRGGPPPGRSQFQVRRTRDETQGPRARTALSLKRTATVGSLKPARFVFKCASKGSPDAPNNSFSRSCSERAAHPSSPTARLRGRSICEFGARTSLSVPPSPVSRMVVSPFVGRREFFKQRSQ